MHQRVLGLFTLVSFDLVSFSFQAFQTTTNLLKPKAFSLLIFFVSSECFLKTYRILFIVTCYLFIFVDKATIFVTITSSYSFFFFFLINNFFLFMFVCSGYHISTLECDNVFNTYFLFIIFLFFNKINTTFNFLSSFFFFTIINNYPSFI